MARRRKRPRNRRPRSRGKKGKSPRDIQTLGSKDNDDTIFFAAPQTAEEIDDTLRSVDHLIAFLEPSIGSELAAASAALEASMHGSAVGHILSMEAKKFGISELTSAAVMPSHFERGEVFSNASAVALNALKTADRLDSLLGIQPTKGLDAAGQGVLREMLAPSNISLRAHEAMMLGLTSEAELTSRAKLEVAHSSIRYETPQTV